MVSQFAAPVVGGQERAVENLLRGLADRGHDVALATFPIPGADVEPRRGITVHPVRGLLQRSGRLYADPRRRHAPPFPDPAAVRELHRIVERTRPDVVHAHDWLAHSLVAVRRRSGVPMVLTIHDHGLVCATKRLVRRDRPCSGPAPAKCAACASSHYGALVGPPVAATLRARRAALRRAVDRFLPVSDAVARSSWRAMDPARVTVVPNFLPDDFASRDEHVEVPPALPDGGFLLYVGDASRDKGADVLLAAYRRLGAAPPLVFVGRPLIPMLATPPPGVIVFGPQPHEVAREAMRRARLVVVPSISPETFGLAALEPMAFGRPVVASSIGALGDLVHDAETGLLVPPGDAAMLAAAVQSLLDDPARCERLGDAARRRASDFTASSVLPRLEQVYAEVTA
jgi:glycosyltransferase involved in cell wall biosynthesis